MHNLVWDCEFYSDPVYLGIGAVVLTIADLSHPLLLSSLIYIAIAITMGQNFDASSRHCFKIQLVSPMLYLLFGVLLSNPCVKMIELYHLGFLFSMVVWSKRFVKTILVIDIRGKAHTFSFAPYDTIKDVRYQINTKFQITNHFYWLSCGGKPLHVFVPLEEITGTVIINGQLIAVEYSVV